MRDLAMGGGYLELTQALCKHAADAMELKFGSEYPQTTEEKALVVYVMSDAGIAALMKQRDVAQAHVDAILHQRNQTPSEMTSRADTE